MSNNKLHITLQALSVYEMNRLKKFVLSPYFNVNESISSYFNALHKLYRTSELASVDKMLLWKELFPKKKYDDTKFRKLNTDLLKLIEEFLSIEQFQRNPLHKANYLLKDISERKLQKLYNSTINTVRRLSKLQLEKPASFYYYQYQIEKNIFSLTTEFERKTKSKSELSNFNVSKIAENLDLFFLAEKMRFYNTLLTWQNVSKHQEKILFVDDLVKQIQNIEYQAYPPLHIHYMIYLSTVEPDEDKHYNKLIEIIEEHLEIFPRDEAKDIFESAINYCVRKINKGNNVYLQELFSLYEKGLETRVMLSNDEITPTTFRNICFCSLRLQKYDWTENFIRQYAPLLNEQYRTNAVTFNLARVYWYKGDFEKVLEQLRDVEYEDILYNINSKIMQLSVYYELDEYEALDSLAKSFKIFLRRQKTMPDRRKNNYSNFIKYLERLSKIHGGEKDKLSKFIEDLENETSVSSKFWLKEKASEMVK